MFGIHSYLELLDIAFSLSSLVLLEIILGIDNLVFLAILTDRLPEQQRKKARRIGLSLAWITRLILLACAVWLMRLTQPLFALGVLSFSIRDLFLLIGGAFLIAKATQEINFQMSRSGKRSHVKKLRATFVSVVTQVAFMDIIFSLDSVLTAVGLTNFFWVMALSITIAIFVMIYASDFISLVLERYPTLNMLALSFLILIGTVLVADSFSFHVPRGYIYFAMGFSLSVEALNLLRTARFKPTKRK